MSTKAATNPEPFSCYFVTKDEQGAVTASMAEKTRDALPDGEVLIRVECSSLNYKDALAATAHPGVVRNLPHVPGIDAAGAVVSSESPDLAVGDQVLVTGYDLGAGQWGGWSQYVRVPSSWVIKLPSGLSCRSAMLYGTAGLTAAMSIESLERHGVVPDSGQVVVTGATGGVGILAVMILAKLGYQVAAVTGKKDEHQRLVQLGAAQVIAREEVSDDSGKPLLKPRWAGAVDAVGGNTLATLIKSTRPSGCIAACGLVGGTDINTTVYPFLLRGVTLAGIDSAWYPQAKRRALWDRLAGPWSVDLELISSEVELSAIGPAVDRILAGHNVGRVLVTIP